MSSNFIPPKDQQLPSTVSLLESLLQEIEVITNTSQIEVVIKNFLLRNINNNEIKFLGSSLQFDYSVSKFLRSLSKQNVIIEVKKMLCFLKQPVEAFPAIIQPNPQIIYENIATPKANYNPYNNINEKQEESEEEQEIIRPKVLNSKRRRVEIIEEYPFKKEENEESFDNNNSNDENKKLRKRKKYNTQHSSLNKKDARKKKVAGSSRSSGFGLKEISSKVREIIKTVGTTSYKEISDQIVNEINERNAKDEKNIRRRIYDSLNVMKSMKLFRKERGTKKIMWNNNAEEADESSCEEDPNIINFNENLFEIKKEIGNQKSRLQVMQKEYESLQKLIERNKIQPTEDNKKIYFPFIIIEFPENISSEEKKIKVAMNDSQTQAHFAFDTANKLYGDLDAILKIGNAIKISPFERQQQNNSNIAPSSNILQGNNSSLAPSSGFNSNIGMK